MVFVAIFLDFPVFYTFWLLAVHNLDSFVTNCYWNLLLNFTNFLLDNRYLIFAHVDLVLGNWLFNLLDLLTNHNFWARQAFHKSFLPVEHHVCCAQDKKH